MKTSLFWIILVLAVPDLSFAEEQTPQQLCEQYWKFSDYAKRGLIQPIWLGDGDRFCYSRELDSGRQFFLVDPVNNTQQPFFDVPRLRGALAKLRLEKGSPEGVPFAEFTFVQDDQTVEFDLDGTAYLLNLHSYSLKQAPATPTKGEPNSKPAKYLDWPVTEELSPNEEWYVGGEDYNIYLRSTSTNAEARKITTDGIEDFEWDLTEWEGPSVLWSPNSRLIAAKKTDYRKVPKVPFVDFLDPKHSTQWIPYWTAFDPIPVSHLYFINVASTKLTLIEGTGNPAERLVILQWSPDSRCWSPTPRPARVESS